MKTTYDDDTWKIEDHITEIISDLYQSQNRIENLLVFIMKEQQEIRDRLKKLESRSD
jgi:uncharacterized protein YaaN involved in tellurite resistance